jgi:hypothetical protein
VEAKEASGKDAAVEIGAELALDEARNGLVTNAASREKGLEVFADGLVEKGLLGAPGRVASRRLAEVRACPARAT